MSNDNNLGLYARIAAVAVLMVCAAALGLWLGSGPVPPPVHNGAGEEPLEAAEVDEQEIPGASGPQPVFFAASPGPGADHETLLREVQQARDAGIHHYIFDASLTWPGTQPGLEGLLAFLDKVLAEDPEARLLFQLDLNPPAEWYQEHPGAAATVGEEAQGYPSAASEDWLAEARIALDTLLGALNQHPGSKQIDGYILRALEDGLWRCPAGGDSSEANVAGFRAWLTETYKTDDALQTAWGQKKAALDAVSIPANQTEDADTPPSFLELPARQDLLDYRRYAADSVAHALGVCAKHVHDWMGPEGRVLAPYGHLFSADAAQSGQAGFSQALEQEVDGFVTVVSQAGPLHAGPEAPFNSAQYHRRQWMLLDDTATSLAAQEAPVSTRAQQLQLLQARHAAVAVPHGLALAWADAEGTGALAGQAIWHRFEAVRRAYGAVWRNTFSRVGPLNPPEVPETGEVPLMVVLDAGSVLFDAPAGRLQESLVRRARNAAVRTHVPLNFCLMEDVLSGTAPAAVTYLFLNAFSLDEEATTVLHRKLTRQKSSGIWLYAPGILGGESSIENMRAVTQLNVQAFDGPAKAGSVARDPEEGSWTWLEEGEKIGVAEAWDPLFYVEVEEDDPETLVMARYADSEQPSVVVKFLDTGWTTAFIAEPQLTPNLLREILWTLDVHIYCSATRGEFTDPCHFGPSVMAISALSDGVRSIDLNRPFDVFDLLELDERFEPLLRWRDKQFLDVPLKQGETRLLYLQPLAQEGAPPQNRIHRTLDRGKNATPES